MSVAAIILAKDEADIIGHTVVHLLNHVDEVLLYDNNSTDGSSQIMRRLAARYDNVHYKHDPNEAHYQSRKMTAFAHEAYQRGHRWVLPVDADEIWYAPEGRSIRDWLDANGREIQFVKAAIYNHVCTSQDNPGEVDPVNRICWRQRVPLDIRWGKVACRCRPDLVIENGNHSARTEGVGMTGYGLEIRHFPYRSKEQFVSKSMNGYNGLRAAVGESQHTGAHVRAYGQMIVDHGVEAGYAWFMDAFCSEHPEQDDSLVYDPAPGAVV